MADEISVKSIDDAAARVNGVVSRIPLWFSERLSREYGAKIYLKREDLQEVRSYKIRGAYNLMSSLSPSQRKNGVVCASAGNHAQGVAFSAFHLKIKAVVFMPITTPLQKISRVNAFGGKWVETRLVGQNYDETYKVAKEYCNSVGATFAHPFDDYKIMSGQGTIAKEIYDEIGPKADYIVCPIGGGGLISGVSTYMKAKSKRTRIIGAEPFGSPSMYESIRQGKPITLEKIDTFVDGAAVRSAGKKTFKIVNELVDNIFLAEEGKVCTTMIELYQNEGIVVEPAGALSISVLENMQGKLKGKTIVCILSGGNNDILRYPEVMERSLIHKGLKHYFIIEFAQKPGQLRNFVNSILGPTDDIARFEYIKKTSKETGPALVGIELIKKEDLEPLLARMDKIGITYMQITDNDLLYNYII
ncbi:MAG: threonine ammonia-lyase IlvA [Candidatus Micrarchaeota archaeon]|nr:threonine ammonia-lyase IlvA [Candidatus Micrarchaeota archaeon]